jgi:hypothetical protein
MPTERRRIRDRLYQRKRRLRRQVMAGKITQARLDAILAAYAIRQLNTVDSPTQSTSIPPVIHAMIEACIQHLTKTKLGHALAASATAEAILESLAI